VGVAFEARRRIEAEISRAVTGLDDFSGRPGESAYFYADQVENRKLELVALRGAPRYRVGEAGLPTITPDSALDLDEVLGGGGVGTSRTGNSHAASVGASVRTDWRRRGVGRALVEAGEAIGRSWGCSIAQQWSGHRLEDAVGDTLTVAGSRVPLGRDDRTRFNHALGYDLVQVERMSTMPVPEQPMELPASPQGYELVQWQGVVPEQWAEGVAVCLAAMWTDPPNGEMDIRPEPYDAERVVREQTLVERWFHSLPIAARHVESAEIAGFTFIDHRPGRPEGAFQGDTIVLAPHRGHGLGMAMKAANVVQVQRLAPSVRRVHTWNAGENDHMWTINERLGYRTSGLGGAWQKTL